MPWVSDRELKRLERELAYAKKRADEAEDRLAAERQAKDWLTVQLASRVVTKGGQYGLDHEKPEKLAAPDAHPKGYTHEPTEMDIAKLEYYKREFLRDGRSEEEAQAFWEAEMRGESPTPIYMVDGEQ